MRDARPWLGFFIGLILGFALALLLQQAGVWPLDQLLLFGLAGIFGLIGNLLGRLGRESVGAFSGYFPLVLAVAMIAYGGLGLADVNQNGQLIGGCRVIADSDIDSTTVTDTSRRSPFDIDPEGGLDWKAGSPGPIMDHTWQIHVEFGGFNVPIASGGDPNEGGSVGNEDQIEDLTAYIQTVTVATGQELRGTFIVGGYIAVNDGASKVCHGFGFVRLISDGPFESLVAKVAAALALLALLILLMLFLRRESGEAGGEEAAAEAGAAAEQAETTAERRVDKGPGPPAAGGIPGDDGGGDDDDDADSSGYEPGAEDLPERDDLA